MAVIKCKMCGGDLVIEPGATVAECEYCGSRQTVPTADNEKKLTLFARANRLRAACEFDKAAGVYEAIVADFPQEAEAYWGLVLCKYGIEYVDDPATGKKIPTCHRSSFESVLDDSNFDQAQENADVVARKVYREEAKQIEALRKGIIEVSAQEAPYDIFICYKETDEKGDRTLDSVLAQDIYDALTEKGYRVFFSRITLEDKLGQAYEPYIFAALNSAKIMLAVGTDYEYYNAVWVKNEWSRYLMLMAKDRTKHLIPCYKNIDAYDMPREFAKLQAQDMGKVGAMQDLLRGIEKILPKNQPVTVVQEKIIVGGDSKIASLLDRGIMALEDGDWAKADSFFEDVLNNDSKNAQAYIGKTLAQEQCRTMDALVRKRLGVYGQVQAEALTIPERTEYIAQMGEKYRMPGYVKPEDIQKLYEFDRTYPSEVSGRQAQCQEEEHWWANHKLLSRAEKFASGAVAEQLRQEKQRLFAQLADRVKQAQAADAQRAAAQEKAYDAAIQEADAKAEQLYQENFNLRERRYQSYREQAQTETDPQKLRKLAEQFDNFIGDYKDGKALAEQCRAQAKSEQAKIDAERERQLQIALQISTKKAAAKKRRKIIALAAAVAVIVTVLLVTQVILPGIRYGQADALLSSGQYQEAAAAFEALGSYKDSAVRASYAEAASLLASGKTGAAAIAFGKSGDYQDAKQRSAALWDKIAVRDTISAGDWHTIGLKSDGTVVAVGNNKYGQCDVSIWQNIVAISAGLDYTFGLKSDGTVVAVGNNKYGRCNVGEWMDIVAISAGGVHTVGLKSDGTVVAVGDNEYGQCDVSEWKDIMAISAGFFHTIGLKSDGTVVAVGDNEYGQCDVSDWGDIVAVSAGWFHTVGLKSDGTIVAVGLNENGECNVPFWKDIVTVSAGAVHTVGLKSDGTVVAAGYSGSGRYYDISDWKDIVAVSAGGFHTVGLKSDGTAVATGSDRQCDVGNWTDIKIPATSQIG